MAILDEIKAAVIEGDDEVVAEKTQAAVDEGLDPQEIINEGLIAGMDVVGGRFKEGEMFVPEVMMTAAAMKEGVTIVSPLLGDEGAETKGTVVFGTVEGDLHDIGKNLVAVMFDSQGYNVINLGMDVPAEDFVREAKENDAVLVGLSALLTTTMPEMKTVVDKLAEADLGEVKVIIGGAPVTQEYSDEIGADGYSADAQSAVELADRLLGN